MFHAYTLYSKNRVKLQKSFQNVWGGGVPLIKFCMWAVVFADIFGGIPVEIMGRHKIN